MNQFQMYPLIFTPMTPANTHSPWLPRQYCLQVLDHQLLKQYRGAVDVQVNPGLVHCTQGCQVCGLLTGEYLNLECEQDLTQHFPKRSLVSHLYKNLNVTLQQSNEKQRQKMKCAGYIFRSHIFLASQYSSQINASLTPKFQ